MLLIFFAALSAVPLGASHAPARILPARTPAPVPAPSKPPPPTMPSASTLGYLTGNDLYMRCTEASQVGTTYCFAFISGVHDSVRAYEAWLNMREMCIPPGTSQSELRTIFIAYAQSNRRNLAGQAASIVLDAFKKSYPCKR